MPINEKEMKALLQSYASKQIDNEDKDFDLANYSSLEKVYNAGKSDGEIKFARELLREFFGQ
jgi:hypothetical protein